MKTTKAIKKYGKVLHPLDGYLKTDEVVVPKSIRAPEELWGRVAELAKRKGVSVNLMVIAVMSKACDDEGVKG